MERGGKRVSGARSEGEGHLPIEYRVRPTLWSGDQRYVLEDGALVISETPRPKRGAEAAVQTKEQRVALSDLRWLRLRYSPGRLDRNRFDCLLSAQVDEKRVSHRITSMHFRGLGDFVDQADTYTPFVRALCQRAAAENPTLRVMAGYTPFFYYAGLLFLLLLLSAFVTFLVVEWSVMQRLPQTPVRLLLLGSLLLLLASAYRRNRPRSVQADSLPDELLPKKRT